MAGEGAIDGRRGDLIAEAQVRGPVVAGKNTPDGWKIWLSGASEDGCGISLLLDLDRAELVALDMQRTIAVLRQANRRGDAVLAPDNVA